ncbi:hypothetical protein [Halorubrum sp. C191]|uniref:hypothetical protein n=1 Tax=Halorubrum sp. C191 TaxID=1383842 RepID=UPI001181B768|nr:hypothetical protein [Halorubrum sp. C191]
MPSLEELKQILGSESALLVYIPLVNYGLIINNSPNSSEMIVISVFSAIFASILYTVVKGNPSLSSSQTVLFLLAFLVWAIFLGYSMYRLISLFGTPTPIPEALFLLSASIITLIISDGLSMIILDGYDGALGPR